MNIKRALPKDAEIISKIHSLSWKTAYKGFIPQQYLDDLRDDFWANAFKDWIENKTLTALIIYENELPVGCISYGKARGEELPEWGEIISFYVLPDYFGQGYGKKLLKTALEDMKKQGYKNIYLWALEGNVNAKAFYEKNGFSHNHDQYPFEIMGKPLINLRYIFSFDKHLDLKTN